MSRRPDIRPFRALRYTAAADPLGLLLCPPYDVISPARHAELLARSPGNFVRVELPAAAAEAARALASFQDAGWMARDETPALYRHDQVFTWQGVERIRRGFLAAVRLEDPASGLIKPHERTLTGPREERVGMVRAIEGSSSPVFAIYRAAQPLATPPGPPLVEAEADGERHRLWAVTDAGEIGALAGAVGAALYIADGHHRYAAALAYRDERQARGDEGACFILMELVPDEGLLVLATHRLLAPGALPEDVEARLSQVFDLTAIDGDLEQRLAAAGARGPAFVLLRPGGALLLELRDRARLDALLPAERSAEWRALDVAILERAVLGAVCGLDEARLAASALRFTHSTEQARQELAEGKAAAAFLLNPTPVQQMMAVADRGELMPQKSTYFQPKLPSGLVVYRHPS